LWKGGEREDRPAAGHAGLQPSPVTVLAPTKF